MACARAQRAMDREDVRDPQELFKLADPADAQSLVAAIADEGIIEHGLETEGFGTERGGGADAPESEDSKSEFTQPTQPGLHAVSVRAEQGVRKVDMGVYEPVVPWPKPLPDTDLSHDGWTWGSGAGVWAESPDKVWVMQRSEVSLPLGAEPWICACLLNPRRTNTGRRDYSGTPYPYQMRRHHLVFAVDGSGSTIVEWL